LFIYLDKGELYLPKAWQEDFEKGDQLWVAKRLFKWGPDGKPTLDDQKITQLWYEPPAPSALPSHPPGPNAYFHRRLFAWFPSRLWRYAFHCDKEGCKGGELVKAGLYSTVRKVVFIVPLCLEFYCDAIVLIYY
jgi:hypothetical protein